MPSENQTIRLDSSETAAFLASMKEDLFQKMAADNRRRRVHADDRAIKSDIETILSVDYQRYKIGIIERDTGVSLKGKRLLELGSGFGLFLIVARAAGIIVVGTEPYSDFYANDQSFAKRILGHFGLGKDDLLNERAEALGFPDNHFDVVTSYYVFEHVQDPLKALKESLRVLKPGGHVHFVFPNYGSFWEGHYAVPWIPNLSRAWGARYLKYIWRRDPVLVPELNLFNERQLQELLQSVAAEAEVVGTGREIFEKEISTLSFDKTASIGRVAWIFALLKSTGLLRLFVKTFLKLDLYTPFYLTLRKRGR